MSTSVSWRARLEERGFPLPEVVAPIAAYRPAVRAGDVVYTSGQLPFVAGVLPVTGRVGDTVSVEDARRLAAQCAANALAAAVWAADGRDVVRIIKVVGFVASAPDFAQHSAVIDGASELRGEAFGSAGHHARSAVGVAALPLGSPVEVELIVGLAPASEDGRRP